MLSARQRFPRMPLVMLRWIAGQKKSRRELRRLSVIRRGCCLNASC
ncbi:hypothetical protein XCR_1391 [Xanthomonas campestris pv. raphani 756C]|nr:hypothetical protein XCR_1391 [Xanthomonas campestris pv. raphani 756C]